MFLLNSNDDSAWLEAIAEQKEPRMDEKILDCIWLTKMLYFIQEIQVVKDTLYFVNLSVGVFTSKQFHPASTTQHLV